MTLRQDVAEKAANSLSFSALSDHGDLEFDHTHVRKPRRRDGKWKVDVEGYYEAPDGNEYQVYAHITVHIEDVVLIRDDEGEDDSD